MANRIHRVDPAFTLLTAYCANEAYVVLNNPVATPPEGYSFVETFTGRNPSYLDNSVERYGFIAQNNSNHGEYIIAFRGTDSMIDRWEDLFAEKAHFTPYREQVPENIEVAAGFMDIYSSAVTAGESDSMQDQLFQFIGRVKPTSLIITGHSLGSSLAELFTLDLYTTKLIENLTIKHYNYACPRVGNAHFARLYNSLESLPNANRTIRFVNYWDEIPCLPFADLGYEHGSEYFLIAFYEKGADIPHYLIRHSMYNYWHVLQKGVNNVPQGYQGDLTGYEGVLLESTIPEASKKECDSSFPEDTEQSELETKRGCLNFLGIFKK